MKLHATAVERLVYICQNVGGYRDENRLLEAFSSFLLSPYIRKENTNDDPIVLVESKLLFEEAKRVGVNLQDTVVGTFHQSVVTKIMEIYQSHSGHAFEQKLRAALTLLDFSPYHSQFTGKTVWVLTSDMMKAMRGQNIRS